MVALPPLVTVCALGAVHLPLVTKVTVYEVPLGAVVDVGFGVGVVIVTSDEPGVVVVVGAVVEPAAGVELGVTFGVVDTDGTNVTVGIGVSVGVGVALSVGVGVSVTASVSSGVGVGLTVS